MNRSPWIAQIKKERAETILTSHHTADVGIVGGGISGLSTAYFLLTRTELDVALLEAGRIAHGATGHNAGQLVTYFERPFKDLVREFGLAATAEAHANIESSWGLLEEMRELIEPRTPINLFIGYAGILDVETLVAHLENNALRKKSGLLTERVRVANIPTVISAIPERLNSLYSIVPHDTVLSLLETKDASYIAALSAQKGTMNSALFTEEIAGALLVKYPKRFSLFEKTPVKTITIGKEVVQLMCTDFTVKANEVVLCTNGFEHFTIEDDSGQALDKRFHEEVYGTVGYMSAYLEPLSRPPTAISYLPIGAEHQTDPYFYLTRRPYEVEPGEARALICIGGPEATLDEKLKYDAHEPVPEQAIAEIQMFMQRTPMNGHPAAQDMSAFHFSWNGLMGYTKNGVRLIGRDPCTPRLLYNLGCNGVGIMPAIFGGKKIAEIFLGIPQKPTIFDPFHGSCQIPGHRNMH